MSTEPAEALLDGVIDGDGLADLVESELDAHPLPVDEQDVARAVARLQARMGRAPRRFPWARIAGVALGIAALAVLIARLGEDPVVHPDPVAHGPVVLHATVPAAPIRVVGLEVPARLELPAARRTIELAPDARILASERARVGAVLVQDGAIALDGRPVGAGTWALVTRTDDGTPHDAVFPDGSAPPPLPEPVWGGEVHEQLRDLRWEALPEGTLSTLETLLEAP